MQPATKGANLRIEGTPYFRSADGCLRRVVRVQLPEPFSGLLQARVLAAGETVCGEYQASNGSALVDGPSAFDADVAVELAIQCSAGSWTGRAILSPTRKWTIYVAQDKHLDYGWIHPVEQVVERMNILTDYYLRASERVGLRWNLGVTIWVEEYLRARPPQERERLISALRSGALEVSAFWLVPYPGLMDTEEVLRCLAYARHLQESLDVPVRTASLQEVPSLPWGYATILAGAGFPYVVKGAYDLRNPHLKERDPLPLVAWEGPDGSSVLLRWDAYDGTHSWGGYAEAYKLWRASTNEERIRFVEDTVSRYEGYESYPVDAILLDGAGLDEYPQTTAISDFIQSFNAQGWEYPRLVDATWDYFWVDVEQQLRGGSGQVPVLRGDWGTTWEEWPAQLARLSTVYRRVRETVLSAQALSAFAEKIDPPGHKLRARALAEAWRGLLQFADHNIGGIDADTTEDMRDRKAAYVYTAAREGARALQGGLATIAASVPGDTPDERKLLVANPGSWHRGGIVEVMVPEPGPYDLVDLETGQPLPCQLETRGAWPEHYLSFVAADVPGFGYRCYSIRDGSDSVALADPAPSEPVLENEFYRLTVDEQTGGLCALWDKVAGRDLVGRTQGVALNEYLHHSDGVLHRPKLESVAAREGPLGQSLVAEVSSLRARLRTTYQLTHTLRRIDIVNELTKEPSDEPQCSWFAFPLAVADHQYYYDGPAAVLRAGLKADGGDLLPGAGRTCVAVRSFLAKANPEFGAVIATPDAYLFQFGAQVLDDPLSDSDPSHPLVLSLAMHNFTRNDCAVNQGGHKVFEFRYRVTGTDGAFSGSAAVRFAKEAAQSLPAAWVRGGESASLPEARHAFLSVSPDNVIATGLKVAEDGDGWVLRLWECEGRTTAVTVDAEAMGVVEAWSCDLLERRGDALEFDQGKIKLDVPARGLRALRFAAS